MDITNILIKVDEGSLRSDSTESEVKSVLGDIDYQNILTVVGTIAALLAYKDARPRRCRSRRIRTKFRGIKCLAVIVSVHVEEGYFIEICSNGHRTNIPTAPSRIRRMKRKT